MEKSPNEITKINQQWHALPEGHIPPTGSKEEFVREILMRLITTIRNDYNGHGAKLKISEELRRLDEL